MTVEPACTAKLPAAPRDGATARALTSWALLLALARAVVSTIRDIAARASGFIDISNRGLKGVPEAGTAGP